MTDADKPAAHVEVSESSGAEYAAVTAHASQYGRRRVIKRVVAVLLTVPYVGLVVAIVTRGNGGTSVVVSAFVLGVLGVVFWAVNSETFKAAGTGIWRKSCPVVVEAEGQVSATQAYLVLRPSGIHVQTVSTRWFRAQFRTEHSFPWAAVNSVEFIRRGSRWHSVVLSGPGVRVALIGSVNRGFAEALEELGATLDPQL